MMPNLLDELLPSDEEIRRLLQNYGFDPQTFATLRERLRAGNAESENLLQGTIEPPRPGDVVALPPLGSDAREMLGARGREAIREGAVGVVFLAGGMATRFGGAVKAAVEVAEGKSFLDLKLRDVQRMAAETGGTIPVFLMTSFSTDAEVRRLGERGSTPSCPVHTFAQSVSLRLTPEGGLFRGNDGKVSAYAPGHGDMTFALRSAGLLQRFISEKGRVLYMTNVDNATATLDPAVIGCHLESGAAITAEVAPKEPGDKGGAPARVAGLPQIVESFRFPKAFDQDSIPVFNTNSFTFDARQLDRDFPLTWFAVRKEVDGRPTVQFERLVGQLSAFLSTRFLRVERHGPDNRFQPVKEPVDLERGLADIVSTLGARGVL